MKEITTSMARKYIKSKNYINGMLGKQVSEETKEKIRSKLKGKNRQFTKEWCNNLSLARQRLQDKPHLGCKHTNESKIKMSNSWSYEKHITPEFRKKQSNARVGKINYASGDFRNVKRGWYQIGNNEMYFRSKWEANYALYLNWLKSINQIKDWTFEEDVFVFHKIQFGTRSYRPDFKITNNDGSIHYDEVKGWMDSKSKTKIKRMKKYYPEIKLTIIDGKEYSSIKRKVGKMLNFY